MQGPGGAIPPVSALVTHPPTHLSVPANVSPTIFVAFSPQQFLLLLHITTYTQPHQCRPTDEGSAGGAVFRVPRALQLFQAAPAMRTVPAGLPQDPYDPPPPHARIPADAPQNNWWDQMPPEPKCLRAHPLRMECNAHPPQIRGPQQAPYRHPEESRFVFVPELQSFL